MSAPQTNVEKEARRHRPALRGIALSVGFAALLLIAFLIYVADRGDAPDGAETQVDGRTGEEVAN